MNQLYGSPEFHQALQEQKAQIEGLSECSCEIVMGLHSSRLCSSIVSNALSSLRESSSGTASRLITKRQVATGNWSLSSTYLGRPLRQIGKPGAYTFEPGEYGQIVLTQAAHKRSAKAAWGEYELMLGSGIAREVARNVLPLSIYTSFYVNFNLRSLMNFLSLRWAHEESKTPTFPLKEIEMVAKQMDAYATEIAPVAMAAFTEFGRVAP
jgi:hypothetical protein